VITLAPVLAQVNTSLDGMKLLCMQKILKKSDICMLDVHPFSKRRPKAWEWIIKFIRLGGELVVNLCFTHLYCLIHSLSISNKKKREKCEEEDLE